MPLDFPTSPSLNDTYTFNNKTWVWNGSAWELQSTGAINGIPIGNATPSTGAFTTLSASGNLAGGNISTAGVVTATGNVSGGNITATTSVFDSKGELRTIALTAKTTSYTLALADAGNCISSNANIAVPDSVFSAGQTVLIYNDSNASINIEETANVTMYQVGTTNTGNRTLAERGLTSIFCVAANTFIVSGGGVS